MDAGAPNVIVFGSNISGQAGVANGEDIVPYFNYNLTSSPGYLPAASIARVISCQKQSYMILSDGSILSCGENDRNELGRNGKRSLFSRIDAVEAYSIADVSCGDGFTLLVTKEGKLISWGDNSFGQLGSNDRENREKPKLNTGIEGILQIASGSQHSLALTKSGDVISWGANRKGQLGDGQLTSSIIPQIVAPLKHRPVISICCGENHSLALTISGSVYAWGDNSQGQLGFGDTKPRLRAELVRSLKAARISKISAGRQHTMAIAKNGLLFAFGSNSFGQLGVDDLNSRCVLSPVVVDRLRELTSLDVCCGGFHTLVLCTDYNDTSRKRVYGMGLNSSGQLGLGHTQNITTPTVIQMPENVRPISLASGPLSMTSYIFTEGTNPLRLSLPAIDECGIKFQVDKLLAIDPSKTEKYNIELRNTREVILNAFSSVSVLNASFRSKCDTGNQRNVSHLYDNANSLSVNLEGVRRAYKSLLSLNNEQITRTLGRASLQLSENLMECPWDDIENLNVFLIVLENPLLLQPSMHQLTIERVIRGILALPKLHRVTLFSWLKSYPSEFFSHIVLVIQTYLAYGFTNKAHNIDPAPAILVLSSLYQCNQEARIIPDSSFYQPNLHKYVNLFDEWKKYKASDKNSKVFNYYSYPFILDYEIKNAVVRIEFQEKQASQSAQSVLKYFNNTSVAIPKGIKFYTSQSASSTSMKTECYFEIALNRENLLTEFLDKLKEVIADDINTLRLPLKVVFIGEPAVDQGGVRKELLTLAIRELVSNTGVLQSCGTNNKYLWFKSSTNMNRRISEPPLYKYARTQDNSSDDICYMLGIITGLAAYNDILIDLPLPPSIYKVMTNTKLILDDLFSVDSALAHGLQCLLDYDEGPISESFGITFTASSNPLLDNSSFEESGNSESNLNTAKEITYVDLKPCGSDIFVERGNRSEFVDLYVNWALQLSCKVSIDSYLSGIKVLLTDQSIDICKHHELEILLSGSKEIGDLSELRQRTKYTGEFHDEHPVVQWFWNALSNMKKYDQRKFLHFVTGSDRVPIGGISKLGLIIQSTGQHTNALPTSHTCFNVLNLPIYESQDQLIEKLNMALQFSEGFGFA